MSKSYIWLWAGCWVGAFLVAAVMHLSSTPVHQQQKRTVEGVAQSGLITVHATGIVEPANREAALTSELIGKVAAVHVKTGDWVQSGDPLLELEATKFECQLAAAEARFEIAAAEHQRLQNGPRAAAIRHAKAERDSVRARYLQAKQTWQRHRELAQNATISAEFLEKSQTEMSAAQAQLEAAEANLDRLNLGAREEEITIALARVKVSLADVNSAKHLLSSTVLTAPFSGQILKIDTQVGELVGPTGHPMLILGDTRDVHVCAWVDELDVDRLSVGTPAKMTVEGRKDLVMYGKVTKLCPQMQSKVARSEHPAQIYDTRTREVWIALDAQPEYAVLGLHLDVCFSPAIQQMAREETQIH